MLRLLASRRAQPAAAALKAPGDDLRSGHAFDPHHRIANINLSRAILGARWSFVQRTNDQTATLAVAVAPAIGGEINRLVGLDIERRKVVVVRELRARPNPAGQFEVISDVEELDHVLMISA